MLPLLPALILLLLQGPSNVERLAHDGRLPAALQAIHQQMDRPEAFPGDVLASLIAVSNDLELSKALYALLSLKAKDDPQPTALPVVERTVVLPSAVPALSEGYFRSQRTRDGPSALLDF
jgi:hypothetical protein